MINITIKNSELENDDFNKNIFIKLSEQATTVLKKEKKEVNQEDLKNKIQFTLKQLRKLKDYFLKDFDLIDFIKTHGNKTITQDGTTISFEAWEVVNFYFCQAYFN